MGEGAFQVQRRLLAKTSGIVIFDCGANVGQTTTQYLKLFPEATIYAFEPNPEVFEKARARHGRNARVVLKNMAVGSLIERKELNVGNHPGTSSFLDKDLDCSDGKGWHFDRKIEVTSGTIDAQCEMHNVQRLHLLKMDIQGYELQALYGADDMLRQKRIDVIYTEVLHSPLYKNAPLHEDITRCLAHYGYRQHSYHRAAVTHGDAIYVLR
jgi:FkbM family methyltransferase